MLEPLARKLEVGETPRNKQRPDHLMLGQPGLAVFIV